VAVQRSKIRKLTDGIVDPPSDLSLSSLLSRLSIDLQPQIIAMVCTQSKSSGASAELDYLADMTEFLRASTDMLIVVEGTELPCHKQVMAVHSKVFAGMADLTARLGHGASGFCTDLLLHGPPPPLNLELQKGSHAYVPV